MSDGLPPYIGFAGLWRLELSGLEIAELGPRLEARLARDPRNAEAMMDIATLSILTLIPENRAAAFGLQQRALALRQAYRIPASQQPAALRVLSIVSPGDMTAITHLDCLLEGADVDLWMVYVDANHSLPRQLPEHDLVFVAVGESSGNRPILEAIERWSSQCGKPVLNAPKAILDLSRDVVSRKLRRVPGVVMPDTTLVERARLESASAGLGPFPLIVRPVDSQGGRELAKVVDQEALAAYLQAVNGDRFYASRFIDYSSEDGLFRKYRVVMIDGRAFACHMAISSDWMIHYVNADMDASAAKRDEEARFMDGFNTGFALTHKPALDGIDARMGLDYYAIDCAETREGELLVFEVDTAMLVHAMDPVDLYPYKQPHMAKLFDAFRAMLACACAKAK